MAPSGLQDSSFSANTNQPPYLNASNNQRHDPSAKGLPTNSSLLPPTSTINLPLDMPSTARASKPSLTFSPLNKRTIKKEHNSPVGILSRANSYPLSKEAGSGSAPPTVVKLEPGTTASKRMRTSTGGNSLVTKEEVSLGGSSRKIKKEEGLAEGGTALSSRKEKDAKLASLAKDEEEFVTKYTKAFPSFVFHFDCVEPGALGARVVDLGARIDKFFSRHVTHVVTSRAIPVLNDKENAPPHAPSPGNSRTNSRTSASGSRTNNKLPNPFLDETGQSDVLLKAQAFKMKVWEVKKLQSVVSRLIVKTEPGSRRASSRNNNSLSHLLEEEKLHGTRERDLSAPRPDYHYFTRGAFYVLCEDATGEYRTILAKEYEKPRNGEVPEWPVLHEHFLKPSASAQAKAEAAALARAAAEELKRSTDANCISSATNKIPASLLDRSRVSNVKGESNGQPGDLRRSASLNNLGKTRQNAQLLAAAEEKAARAAAAAEDAESQHDPYIAASGNSVNITSTITSAQSGTGMGGGGGGNLAATKGRERRIVELNKRVVPLASGLRGQQPNAVASTSTLTAPSLLPSAISRSHSVQAEDDATMIDLSSEPADAPAPSNAAARRDPASDEKRRQAKTMADHVKATLAAEKEAEKKNKAKGKMGPPQIKKRHSLPGRLPPVKREKIMERLPLREESKKPGYCENCRIKFDDFSTHVVGRRHRRFALDHRQFSELDAVLDRLKREPLASTFRKPPPPFRPLPRHDSESGSDDDDDDDDESEDEQPLVVADREMTEDQRIQDDIIRAEIEFEKNPTHAWSKETAMSLRAERGEDDEEDPEQESLDLDIGLEEEPGTASEWELWKAEEHAKAKEQSRMFAEQTARTMREYEREQALRQQRGW